MSVTIPASQLPRAVRRKLASAPADAPTSAETALRSARSKLALEHAAARARQFRLLCHQARLPLPVHEYAFARESHARNWRWDFAWPDVEGTGGLALECDGGIFVRGRHARGAGILKTHEKLNAATILGWAILYTTPKQLCTAATLDLITRALLRRDVAPVAPPTDPQDPTEGAWTP